MIEKRMQDVTAEELRPILGSGKTVWVAVNSAHFYGSEPLKLSRPGDSIVYIGHDFSSNSTTAQNLQITNNTTTVEINDNYCLMKVAGTEDTYFHSSSSMYDYNVFDENTPIQPIRHFEPAVARAGV